MVPTIVASEAAASVLPALYTPSGHGRRTNRLPARTLSAAVAGPIPAGRSNAATRHGSAPRLIFCSGPILTGNLSATTTATKQAGIKSSRHVSALANPSIPAVSAASATPASGTPTMAPLRGLE